MNNEINMSMALTVPCELALLPLSSICWFAESYRTADISLAGDVMEIPIVPGSLTFRDESSSEGYKKTVAANVADTGVHMMQRLRVMSLTDCVAVFRDGRGIARVCGSPEHPLNLTCEICNGYISLSLTGVDTHPNLILKP